jgi:hypothetical protein
MCSVECYKAHQQKHHPVSRQPLKKNVPIQVVFADGSIYDHEALESALVEEIVFEHPVTKAHARCLRRPGASPGGVPVYAELPQIRKPLPPPLELPRVSPQPSPQPQPSQRSGASHQHHPKNAVTAFSLHVSWLLALIETRDERILKVLSVEHLQRLEKVLCETTIALLETNNHGG